VPLGRCLIDGAYDIWTCNVTRNEETKLVARHLAKSSVIIMLHVI
jgi:hypothetical protein